MIGSPELEVDRHHRGRRARAGAARRRLADLAPISLGPERVPSARRNDGDGASGPAAIWPAHGIDAAGRVYRNPTTSLLYTHALARGDGRLGEGGPLAVDTGVHTGRSPKDKFLVARAGSEDRIWWGEVNQQLPRSTSTGCATRSPRSSGERRALYVVDAWAGADPGHRIGVRVVTAHPYHALFAKTMFIDLAEGELAAFQPEALVLHTPDLEADPEVDGTRTGTFVVLHPGRTELLVGGTFYAGEIKKSIFTVMNDRLPLEGVFPMHCSANVGDDGEVAVFFGLSGTGKTTLSADPTAAADRRRRARLGRRRRLQLRGRLLREDDPALAARRAGDLERTRTRTARCSRTSRSTRTASLDLDDDSKTENTRAAYKLELIANALPAKRAGHPRSVVFLTADAFGILPPIARLSREQALYYFLSGFTAKLAGTEIGVTEPQPTFSTCFGQPFLPQPPPVYARHARRRSSTSTARRSGSSTPAGPAGRSARASACRSARPARCSRAALAGELDDAEFRTDELFGFAGAAASPRRRRTACSTRARPGATRLPTTQGARARRDVRRQLLTRFADVDASIRAAGPRLSVDARRPPRRDHPCRRRSLAPYGSFTELGHEPVCVITPRRMRRGAPPLPFAAEHVGGDAG